MFNMQDIMRQAQEMQGKMAKIQEGLGEKQVEGQSGGGMVRVVCTGKQEVVSITIDPAAIDPAEADMLQDLVCAAVNDALRRARELAEAEMSALTGGMRLPGMM
ncbi:YbaB/EbfC family nucleoid-associated protein [Desulfovibrio cuneatus]|uniref:YbaB/EbfC family nucleoid-associated protein n=1 Tax=Desulfovibrio cuneatus TaxID=159728 RepID=UPI0004205B89|nr:YbaB/EbfC family nucleoid-associated protein [Desulfovibrio cuneatus]